MIERYTRKEMGEIWSDLNKFRLWLNVELSVCRAWQRLGKIPEEALRIIEVRGLKSGGSKGRPFGNFGPFWLLF